MIIGNLQPSPVMLVAAVRSGYQTPLADPGLRERGLRPLDTVAARALVDRAAPWLSETEREQVLVGAGGNPLALTELPDAPGAPPVTGASADAAAHTPARAGVRFR